jgi:hypothetical protein
MLKKIGRRGFLCVIARTGCGCVLATGIAGCAGLSRKSSSQKESKLGAFCGLYCGSCPLYLSSIKAEDPSKVVCLGCKSDKLAEHCLKCAIKDCASAKNLNSCGQCGQFPCEKTKQFHGSDKDMAKVAERNCYSIRQTSYSAWIKKQPGRWACKNCGSMFSFSDETCPNCKADIYSCKEEATDYLEKRI